MQKYGKIPESKHTPSLYFSKNRKKALYSPTFDKKPSRYHHWQHEGNKSWHLVGIAHIHAQGFPRVVHKLSVCLSRSQWLCTVGCDEHDVELSLLQHPLKLALPLSDGHHLTDIVILDADGAESALFIVVVGALILIEFKLSVTSGIDVQVNEFRRLLVAPFHVGTDGQDGTFRHKHWDALVRSIDD